MAIEKNTEKMKALDAVLLQIEKQYGKGSIMRLGDEAGNTEIEVITLCWITLIEVITFNKTWNTEIYCVCT